MASVAPATAEQFSALDDREQKEEQDKAEALSTSHESPGAKSSIGEPMATSDAGAIEHTRRRSLSTFIRGAQVTFHEDDAEDDDDIDDDAMKPRVSITSSDAPALAALPVPAACRFVDTRARAGA